MRLRSPRWKPPSGRGSSAIWSRAGSNRATSGGGLQGVALEFPVLIDQVFDWGSIYLQDPASATPINMLIDANGNIRWKLVGQQPPLDVLRAQIELVIEEPYAPPA